MASSSFEIHSLRGVPLGHSVRPKMTKLYLCSLWFGLILDADFDVNLGVTEGGVISWMEDVPVVFFEDVIPEYIDMGTLCSGSVGEATPRSES